MYEPGSNLIYSTYFGGSGGENGDIHTGVRKHMSMVVDDDGNIYIAGSTMSKDLPTTPGAYNSTGDDMWGSYDVSVFMFSASGDLEYCTYVASPSDDFVYDLQVDATGNAYICGYTDNSFGVKWPVTTGALNQANGNAFLTKLNPDGTGLVYSALIGGSMDELPYALELDDSGNAYLVGYTTSTDYPTTVGVYDDTYHGNPGGSSSNGFVTKVNADGTAILLSTFIGGTAASGYDTFYLAELDSSGDILIAGETNDDSYPTTTSALDTTFNELVMPVTKDVVVTKLSADFTSLVFSSFYGNRYWEEVTAMTTSPDGEIFLFGDYEIFINTTSDALYSDGDGWVAIIDEDCTELLYASALPLIIEGVAFDLLGSVYIAGTKYENSYGTVPVTDDAFDDHFANVNDSQGVILRLTPDMKIPIYGTYIGGADDLDDLVHCLGMDGNNPVVCGRTSDTNFPVTTDAYDQSYNGGLDDWFITRMARQRELVVAGGGTFTTKNPITVSWSVTRSLDPFVTYAITGNETGTVTTVANGSIARGGVVEYEVSPYWLGDLQEDRTLLYTFVVDDTNGNSVVSTATVDVPGTTVARDDTMLIISVIAVTSAVGAAAFYLWYRSRSEVTVEPTFAEVVG